MKKFWFNIICLSMVFAFSCKEENRIKRETLNSSLVGIEWENADLDLIGFDTSLLYLSIKELHPAAGWYEYSTQGDTLKVINNLVDSYNLVNYKDSLSLIKFNYLQKDSFQIELLNSGAKELFNGFGNLTFYNTQTVDRFSYYIEKDSTCRNGIDSAMVQVKEGLYAACFDLNWRFRQKNEFLELLEKNGIKYIDPGLESDVLPSMRNCYCETMNYFLEKKYGKKFIEKTKAKADTMMVQNGPSRVYKSIYCDEKPHLPGKSTFSSDEFYVKVDLPIKENRKVLGMERGKELFAVYNPFVDVEFNIDDNGQISDLHVINFNPELDWNKQFKDTLYSIALAKVMENPRWVPCKILGKKVLSEERVKIQFKSRIK